VVARDAIGCATSSGNIQLLLVGYQNKTALKVDRGVNSSNASSRETIEVGLLLLSAIDVPDVAAQLSCKVELEARRVLDYHEFLSGLHRRDLLAHLSSSFRRHALNRPLESDRTFSSCALQYRVYQIRRTRRCARNGTSATNSARPAICKTKHSRQVFRNSPAPRFRPDSYCSSSPNNFDVVFCLVASP